MAISTASSTSPCCDAEPERLPRVLQIGAVLRSEARRHPPVQARRRTDPLPHVTPVALEGRRRLSGFVEAVPAEDSNRLEQPVATRAGQAHDEALVDQLTEHRDRRGVRQRRGRCFDGVDVERRREHAEVPEQALLDLVEQAVAPVDRRLHRGVPLRVARGGAPTAAQVGRRGAGSTRRDRNGGAGRRPARAPAGHRRAGDRARSPPGPPDPTAPAARRHGRARRTAPAPRRGADRAARRAHRPPRAAPGWWPECAPHRPAPASGRRARPRARGRARSCRARAGRVDWPGDRPRARSSPTPRPPRRRLRRRLCVTSACGGTGERSTNTTPSAYSACSRSATARATVVLPIPPDPVIVTRRRRGSAR